MEGGERIKASGRRFEKGRIGVRVEGEEDSHGRCVIPGRETEGEGERERESIQSLTTLRAYPLCRIEARFGADLSTYSPSACPDLI